MNMITSCYTPIDIELKGVCKIDNPFYAALYAVFKGPQGQSIKIPGFYDGDSTWKIRFSPNSIGEWSYNVVSTDVIFNNTEGIVNCIENSNKNIHGALKIDSQSKEHFIFEDGEHYFMMPYECDFLWAMELAHPGENKMQNFIESIKKYGFNGILMNVYAHDTSWYAGNTSKNDYGPPISSVWEGSNENPDHNHFNINFFKNYDNVVQYLLNEGFTVHLYFKVYNKKVNWPKRYSKEDDLYFKYITARYQAFPNIIWDFSKESYLEPDKKYIRSRFDIIKEYDGYGRLTTIHDNPGFCYDNKNHEVIDFFCAQQFYDFYYHIIAHKLMNKCPVLNAEFGYEHGPKGPSDVTYPVSNTPIEITKRAYEIVMAGGYFAYYYTYTAWDVIDWSCEPDGYKYMKILYDFFSSIEWFKMVRYEEACCWRNTRCIAIPGKEYVVFVRGLNGKTMINLDGIKDNIEAYWMNIYTGEKLKADLKIGDYINTQSPFNDDSILHIKINN